MRVDGPRGQTHKKLGLAADRPPLAGIDSVSIDSIFPSSQRSLMARSSIVERPALTTGLNFDRRIETFVLPKKNGQKNIIIPED
jgi:hypothetical protein